MFVRQPDVLDTFQRHFERRAVKGGTVVVYLSLCPRITPDTGGLGLEQKASVIHKSDFHNVLKQLVRQEHLGLTHGKGHSKMREPPKWSEFREFNAWFGLLCLYS